MRIHLPAETWEEILEWLNRREFAKKMELLWDREFTPIASKWLHEWHRNVSIGKLRFIAEEVKSKNGKMVEQACLQKKSTRYSPKTLWYSTNMLYGKVPIANVKLPANIKSFQSICVSFLNPTVMNFLHQMHPLLSNIHLIFGPSAERLHCGGIIYEPSSEDLNDHLTALGLLLPTINGPLESIQIKHVGFLHLLKDYFPTVLADAKVLSYCSYYSMAANPSAGWELQCVLDWLFSPNCDGLPRKLGLGDIEDDDFGSAIMKIRERFLAPNRQSCYFFTHLFHNNLEIVEDSIHENTAMGEQLVVRKADGELLISCYQVNEDKKKIASMEEEFLDWDLCDKDRRIYFWEPKVCPINGTAEDDDDDVEDADKPGTSQQAAKRKHPNGEEASTSTNVKRKKLMSADPKKADEEEPKNVRRSERIKKQSNK